MIAFSRRRSSAFARRMARAMTGAATSAPGRAIARSETTSTAMPEGYAHACIPASRHGGLPSGRRWTGSRCARTGRRASEQEVEPGPRREHERADGPGHRQQHAGGRGQRDAVGAEDEDDRRRADARTDRELAERTIAIRTAVASKTDASTPRRAAQPVARDLREHRDQHERDHAVAAPRLRSTASPRQKPRRPGRRARRSPTPTPTTARTRRAAATTAGRAGRRA